LELVENNFENFSSKEKLIFLAGVFEGEGSLGNWNAGGFHKDGIPRKYFRIAVQMTDQDIVQRFANFFKMGTISVYNRKKDGKNYKTAYVWKLNSKPAIDAMLQLYPYLGIRRQEKFIQCYQYYQQLPH